MSTAARYGRLVILDLRERPFRCIAEVAPTPTGPWRRAGRRRARQIILHYPEVEVNGQRVATILYTGIQPAALDHGCLAKNH